MIYIFFTLLFLIHSSLFSMKLTAQPSNSGSEIWLFIKNIDNAVAQYCPLTSDTKNKIFTMYIASSKYELKKAKSGKYKELMTICEYMDLDKNNKLTIDELLNNDLLTTESIKNKTYLMFKSFENAPKNYQQTLSLPPDIKRKIANKYAPIVLVKEKTIFGQTHEYPWLKKKQILENRLCIWGIINGTIAALTLLISCGLLGHCSTDSAIMVIMGEFALGLTFYEIYNSLYPVTKNLALYHCNGYKVLPLLLEHDKIS